MAEDGLLSVEELVDSGLLVHMDIGSAFIPHFIASTLLHGYGIIMMSATELAAKFINMTEALLSHQILRMPSS